MLPVCGMLFYFTKILEMTEEQINLEKMTLFEFFQEFFNRSSTSRYHLVPDKIKLNNAFMLKRYLAIKHPEFIHKFGNITNVPTIDALRLILVPADSKKSPGWMYLYSKAKSKHVDVTDEMRKFDSDAVNMFYKKYELTARDFEHAVMFHLDDVIKELQEMEEMLNKNVKLKKK